MSIPPIIVHHMASPHDQFMPNSLEAIRACLAMNAAFIEVDIMALADEDYLLVHDSVLESETTSRGEVGQLRATDAAKLYYRGADGEPKQRVPLLSEVVQTLVEYGGTTRLQLDYKNVFPFQNDEPLRRLIRLIEPLGERVLVSSGADWQLRKLRKLADWLDLGLDVHYYLDWRKPNEPIDPRIPPFRQGAYGYWDDHILATQPLYSITDYLADRCAMLTTQVPRASTFYINYRMVLQSLEHGFNWADALHEVGMKLDIWTLDIRDGQSEANAQRLLEMGVDQFTTNTPHELARVLGL